MLAAVGSYLQTRSQGGRWLLRIEDVDTTRSRPQAELQILRTLEAFGFEWDGPVWRQSTRSDAYAAALATLQSSGQLFRCSCSRRDMQGANDGLGARCCGHCEQRQSQIANTACSWRWRVAAHEALQFNDLWQGMQRADPAELDDIVLRRRDGLHAYQLAVVVDDAAQGVTQVVRGADLLASTPYQILLQKSLGLPQPAYGHLPLLLEPDGSKLAKTRRSAAVEPGAAAEQLWSTLQRLHQSPPAELAQAPLQAIWRWAFANWQPLRLRGIGRIVLPKAG